MSKLEKFFEVINYLVLILLIVGQCTVGIDYLIGQTVYLSANLIAATRNFILKRPKADKIKECTCLGITVGLIGMYLLGGIA